MASTLARMMVVTASTKRSPAMAGGKVGTAEQHIASLRMTPLDPASAEIVARYGTGAPVVLLSAFTLETDIQAGDRLVVAGIEYPIRAVANWAALGNAQAYRHLVVEDIRR